MKYVSEDRPKHLQEFLNKYFSSGFTDLTPIPGDASFRSYYRLSGINVASCNASGNYIIMDCPPTYCPIEPFIEMARYLKGHGFSVPEVFHFDNEKGFIVLEDFGTLSLKELLENSNTQKCKEIYCSVIDLLISIQEKTPPVFLKSYNIDALLAELEVFNKWYVPYILNREFDAAETAEFYDIWHKILAKQHDFDSVVVLRDYHVENMMYLKDSSEHNRFGLLDFQDAMIGSPVYDLVSILEDARIEVPRELALFCIDYFARKKGLDKNKVLINYHILGAQRNMRIVGAFARKWLRDRNDKYLKFLPLLWKYLNFDLSSEIMHNMRHFLAKKGLLVID